MNDKYFNSIEVADLLGISANNIYGWSRDNARTRRPFFPKPEKVLARTKSGSRRLVLRYEKKKVLKFLKEAEEKPYYLLPEAQYEAFKAEERKKSELPPSAFNDFHRTMFNLKQKRMESLND